MNLKKILAVAMLTAVMGTMSLPVYATTVIFNDTTLTHDIKAPTGKITVENVKETGVDVVAYQVYHWDTTVAQTGWVKNSMFNGVTIADKEHITDTEIANLATVARYQTTNYTKLTKNTAGNYVATCDAGLYLVMVYGSGDRVYNPSLVAVNLTSDLQGVDGTIDIETNFTDGTNTSFMKSSEITFKKVIANTDSYDLYTGRTAEADGDNVHGDLVAVQTGGTDVDFKVVASVPEYAQDTLTGTAENYYITDTLKSDTKERFVGVKDIAVNTNTRAIVPTTQYTITYYDGTTEVTDVNEADNYRISFTDDFLAANGGKEVVITYTSKLLETAGVNYDENKTTAKLYYTIPNANADTSYGVKEDSTYHYTLASGSAVNGTNDTVEGYAVGDTYVAADINKVADVIGTVGDVDETAVHSKEYDTALQGAQFTMTHDTTNKVYTSTSNANGHLVFGGLDTGAYTLQETAAPSGYTLNNNEYPITVSASFDFVSGKMLEYAIGNATYTNYTGVTDLSTTNFVNADDITVSDVSPIAIINTRADVLPSTGGAGTIVLTTVAGVGMAGFLALHLYNKKKEDKSEE